MLNIFYMLVYVGDRCNITGWCIPRCAHVILTIWINENTTLINIYIWLNALTLSFRSNSDWENAWHIIFSSFNIRNVIYSNEIEMQLFEMKVTPDCMPLVEFGFIQRTFYLFS